MEFFREINPASQDLAQLQQLLRIANLPALCGSINNVLSDNGASGEVYTVWGQFNINREPIRCGVRFTLANCPQAFAWTITINNERKRVVVHCTTDKTEHEPDFVESIEQFMDEWQQSLANALAPPGPGPA